MRRRDKSTSLSPWVDIFSGPFFQGRMTRLWANSREGKRSTKSPRLGSLIVGPGAVAEVTRQGDASRIQLSQLTVLADASRLTNGHGLKSLRVAVARN
jgi:hypothetical protein